MLQLALQAVIILQLANGEETPHTRFLWLTQNVVMTSFHFTDQIQKNEALSVELNPLNAVFLARVSPISRLLVAS